MQNDEPQQKESALQLEPYGQSPNLDTWDDQNCARGWSTILQANPSSKGIAEGCHHQGENVNNEDEEGLLHDGVQFSNALISHGFEKFDKISMMGFNVPKWFLAN